MSTLASLSPMLVTELASTACIAGFIDTLAGGGGLITLPALLLTGFPVISVLATGKIQSTFGSSIATFMMMRHSLVNISEHKIAFLAALVGAAIGTFLVQIINANALNIIVPIALFVVCLYVLLSPKLGDIPTQACISKTIYSGVVIPIIGAYDGMLGPGTGSFFALSSVAWRGERLLNATAQAKLLNFGTNIASAVIFIVGGHVIWPVALAMGLGQMVGAVLGGQVLSRGKTWFIRPLIVTVSIAMIARYFLQHVKHE